MTPNTSEPFVIYDTREEAYSMALKKWARLAKARGLRVTVKPLPRGRNEPQHYGVYLVEAS